MSEDWTNHEVSLVVDDYLAMLQKELEGQNYVKKEHRIKLLPKLNRRSEGSIEFKYQNISAVLDHLGEPHIKGYKPRSNYQQLLEDQVIKALQKYEAQLEPLFGKMADEPEAMGPVLAKDLANCLEDGPPRSKIKPKEANFRSRKLNYGEREEKNRSLGLEGERFVIEFEKWRLTKAGRADLADQIRWTSRDKGDGAGYDILSKDEDGNDRYIEVKTTKLSKEAPIYFSLNEFLFSQKHSGQFYLYRVFNFGPERKLFILKGGYDEYLEMVPMTYKGIF